MDPEGESMTKRLVDIDDDALAAARAAAGTPTIRATVHAGLERLVADAERREHLVREGWSLIGDAIIDLHDEDVMRDAWR